MSQSETKMAISFRNFYTRVIDALLLCRFRISLPQTRLSPQQTSNEATSLYLLKCSSSTSVTMETADCGYVKGEQGAMIKVSSI